jgi:HEAT repeat protein
MPLVRAAVTTPQPAATPSPTQSPTQSRETLLAQLGGPDADGRRQAARALASDPGAVAALAARLDAEPDAAVRDALFASLSDIGGAEAAGLVAPLLRSDDAGLRGGAIETLKRMGEDAEAALDLLLDDPDADIRLLAVEVLRVWSGARAAPRLHRIVEDETEINVCGAAIDVATEVGTEALIPPLQRLAARFGDDQFLSFAAGIACDRIRADARRGE